MAGYRVQIEVAGHAKEYFPGGRDRFDVELDEPATINEILAHLGVPSELVMAVFSAGERRDKDYVAPAGATVTLLTPPSGG